MANRLYDGDTFERNGRLFLVRFQRDDSMQEPWKEHDGHGIVTDWLRRDKAPSERVLLDGLGGSKRYYDVAASIRIALRDEWGCSDPTHTHTTKREQAACAVDRDFAYLRAWCHDEWEWLYVTVTTKDDHGRNESESVGGIDGDHDKGAYLTETAYELADELSNRLDDHDRHVLGCVACKGTGELHV